MQRKGQSALEYLMTYGWAILIIIIVGGVLYYYGVFSPGRLVGESKVGFNKIQVDNWGIAGDNITFVFENRVGKDILIQQIYIENENTTTYDLGQSMSAGERMNSWLSVEIPDDHKVESEEAYQYDIAIEYEYEDYAGRFNVTGTLSGTA